MVVFGCFATVSTWELLDRSVFSNIWFNNIFLSLGNRKILAVLTWERLEGRLLEKKFNLK